MSRALKPSLKSRESVFNMGPDRGEVQVQCPPHLEECITAMEDCCEEVWAAQTLLRRGTRDFPRMTTVLQSQRVYLLVNEATVKRYQADLAEEIEPSIEELIERAESGLKELNKKAHQLQKKVEVAELRPVPVGTSMASQKAEAKRLQIMKKTRERLEAEVRSLEAHVEELEREVLNR
ncbi:hypothetical protein AX16_007796 [Volvariella volvacea WC 439]|nr:hypothetical protein AX16_007796 [Volvariella volvacea WC 439]